MHAKSPLLRDQVKPDQRDSVGQTTTDRLLHLHSKC